MKSLDPSEQTGSPFTDSPAEDRSATVDRLFREHNRLLVGFLFARLRDEQEAKEIAQEAYVKVLRLEQKPGAASFMRSYLFRVAENLAIDRIRQRKCRSRLDHLNAFDEFLDGSIAERAAVAGQEIAFLRATVAELPPKYIEAFRLVKIEDRTFAQVAGLMSISERMVRKYVTDVLIYVHLRGEGLSAEDAWVKVKS